MPQLGPSADPLFLSFQLALAGRYSIERELGRGGMGIVYLAREVHLDRPVAIKLLPPERSGDPALRARFLREARLAAKLSHPNIIPIHAVDDVGGFVFFVMAYIDGETLAHRVRTRGPLPAAEGARVLREAAFALAYAHAQGLVHRDVKPDNILLEAATGRALVADFGIAAAAGDSLGEGVTGTPEFMSPEQALGTEIDPRSDLYGLGATAFYAFSGRLPFEGKNATEVLAKHVTEVPPALASLGLAVPRKLAALVDRCLAKEPEHRPASAEALAEQLGVALEQRRELPAAIRAFVKRNGRLDGGGSLAYPPVLLGVSVGLATFYGNAAGFGLFALGMTAGPFAYFVGAARRMMLLGFAREDLGPSFKAEIEQSREELAIEHGRGPTRLEKVLASTARIAWPVLGVSLPVVVWLTFANPLAPAAFRFVNNLTSYAALIALLTAIPATTAALALLERRRDVSTEMWAKLWMGRIGKLAFSVAKRLLGHRVLGTAMTHRATELSLGMAAENLYDSLPKETRQALGDLPGIIHRLRDDAQILRKRHDELHEALADAGDAATTGEYAAVRADRDLIHDKLGDAVGALETIRLNLLRLHAGSGTVEGLTTHIGLAVEVSAGVERLLAAQDEVERGLKFPRETAATPV
ncbi:MAG TPA: serine/threonine-protein kinase [Gemmatimonadaceae bacterium]|nr:serine/threonine-protein kinase [Gemmatimonadaceae bacterium]